MHSPIRLSTVLLAALLLPALALADDVPKLKANIKPEGDLKLDWVWQPTLAPGLLLVSVHRDGIVNIFSRDEKTGDIKYLNAVHVMLDVLKPNQKPTHMDPHVVLTARNIMYIAGEWTHAHGDHDNIGLSWYQIDPADGSSKKLGYMACSAGVLFQSPNPDVLYLSAGFLKQVHQINLDKEGTPTVTQKIEGKGLGSRLAASPDKKFYYAMSSDAAAWLSCDKDGKLTYGGSVPLPGVPEKAGDPCIFISPDGLDVYTVLHAGSAKTQTAYVADFGRDAATGALTFKQKLDLNGLSGLTEVKFRADGKSGYCCGSPETPCSGFWCLLRDPASGALTIGPKVKGANGAWFFAYAPVSGTVYLGGYWSMFGFNVYQVPPESAHE